MSKTKTTSGIWHYPGKGDFPPKNEPVIVHVVSLTNWVISVTKKGKGAAVSQYEAQTAFVGMVEGVPCWHAIPFHEVVVAWRDVGELPDMDTMKETVAEFQTKACARKDMQRWLVCAAFGKDPKKDMRWINDAQRKFQMNLVKMELARPVEQPEKTKEVKPPVFEDKTGRRFSVESRYEHGVIVQREKGATEWRYAFDFPHPNGRRIYPTEREAASKLSGEAVRRNWRRVAVQ